MSGKKQKRLVVYSRIQNEHGGLVPCFICKEHVTWEEATTEHIIPLSKGGTNNNRNLAISHRDCNNQRGDYCKPDEKGWTDKEIHYHPNPKPSSPPLR